MDNISHVAKLSRCEQIHSRWSHHSHDLSFFDHTVHAGQNGFEISRCPVLDFDIKSRPQETSDAVLLKEFVRSIFRLAQRVSHFHGGVLCGGFGLLGCQKRQRQTKVEIKGFKLIIGYVPHVLSVEGYGKGAEIEFRPRATLEGT